MPSLLNVPSASKPLLLLALLITFWHQQPQSQRGSSNRGWRQGGCSLPRRAMSCAEWCKNNLIFQLFKKQPPFKSLTKRSVTFSKPLKTKRMPAILLFMHHPVVVVVLTPPEDLIIWWWDVEAETDGCFLKPLKQAFWACLASFFFLRLKCLAFWVWDLRK